QHAARDRRSGASHRRVASLAELAADRARPRPAAPAHRTLAMDATVPRVSVIVPCYNQGEFLDEAVGSVLAQTFEDFEIVIADDGSTDEATRAILAESRRPKTRIVRAEHHGLAAARNLAIAQSNGLYLCALDADDRLDPSFLAKTVAVLDRDPSVTFVSAWLRTFGDEAWDWTPASCDLPALLSECTVLTASLVRREAVLAIGGFRRAVPGPRDGGLGLRRER